MEKAYFNLNNKQVASTRKEKLVRVIDTGSRSQEMEQFVRRILLPAIDNLQFENYYTHEFLNLSTEEVELLFDGLQYPVLHRMNRNHADKKWYDFSNLSPMSGHCLFPSISSAQTSLRSIFLITSVI